MEPKIIVNGILLTPAQSMTIRSALNNFMIDLNHNGLGGDEHGVKMRKLYQERISEIYQIIIKNDKS